MYWNDLGAAYGRHGEWKNAVNALKKAVAIKKDYAHAWFNLGFAYENANVLGKAIESYKRAVQIKKEFPEAWLSLGVTYSKQGKLDEARKILPTLKEQDGKMAAELARLIENTPPPSPPKAKAKTPVQL
jgi:tetratricopeptide (TPR) repeat protein